MITIKLTAHGGYVVGDGKCPFNPDEFYLLFANKMIEAKRQGLEELNLSDSEINAILDTAKDNVAQELRQAPVITVRDKNKLLEALDANT